MADTVRERSGYALEGTVYPTLNYAPRMTGYSIQTQPVQGGCTLLLH